MKGKNFIMNGNASPQAYLVRFIDGRACLFYPDSILDWRTHHGMTADGTKVSSLSSYIVPGSGGIMFIRKGGKLLFTSLGEFRVLFRDLLGDTAVHHGVTKTGIEAKSLLAYEVSESGRTVTIHKGWTFLEVFRAELEILARDLFGIPAAPVMGDV